MMAERWGVTLLEPICLQCGADCSPLIRPHDLDWRDEREERCGLNALAVAQHTHLEHRVIPKVGDIVVYWYPWRGMWHGEGPYIVESITEAAVVPPWQGTRFNLSETRLRTARSFPSTNDPRRPITFDIVQAAALPEPTLFDMLDGWAA
ncbi:hypothetical protein SEA_VALENTINIPUFF_97 [Microbacterium phage ValentiniPuff]|uniref:Uncharacterized protein n=1 Tax=Microbacterium phage ValentiniPuff TaxID=2315705 RepID=A0A386KSC1_9CAUD|nr:hypothetical protein SEA_VALENTINIPUFF_97 [Microbacterium phage ValentiniPuff]